MMVMMVMVVMVEMMVMIEGSNLLPSKATHWSPPSTNVFELGQSYNLFNFLLTLPSFHFLKSKKAILHLENIFYI